MKDFVRSWPKVHPISSTPEIPMQTKIPPWKKPAPAKSKHKSLTPAQKSAARGRAKKTGRPYPNLVDNMWASRQK
jgi:hypothetical protein